VVDDLFQLRDGQLLADLAEGRNVRGDAASPALAVALGAGELREVVGTRGNAGADRGRSPVWDRSDHRHRLRHGLRAAAGSEDPGEEESARDGGSEPCEVPGTIHAASIRR